MALGRGPGAGASPRDGGRRGLRPEQGAGQWRVPALFELISPSACPACDAVRPVGSPLLCGACLGKLQLLPWLGQTRTAVAYRGTGARLLRRFKFEGRSDALRVLAPLLAESLVQVPLSVVVPVPRQPARIRELGCDPVRTLAGWMARALGLRMEPERLWRIRETPPQTDLDGPERRHSPRGSFAAAPSRRPEGGILLLDDVITTGSTLAAAALALRSAGAGPIYPAALAGTPALPLGEDPVL